MHTGIDNISDTVGIKIYLLHSTFNKNLEKKKMEDFYPCISMYNGKRLSNKYNAAPYPAFYCRISPVSAQAANNQQKTDALVQRLLPAALYTLGYPNLRPAGNSQPVKHKGHSLCAIGVRFRYENLPFAKLPLSCPQEKRNKFNWNA